MIREYVQAAMERARYEIIADPEPYYGEIPARIPIVLRSGLTC
jgi:hypothetical protein